MEPRISLCMIVKNEEQNIGRCLKSAAGAVDEIIVVDTGSTDATVEIARQNGAQVYFFPWNGSFSDARNASLEPAAGEWILFLDADEELAAGSAEALRRLVAAEKVEGYFLKIINYLGREGYVEPCPDLVFRLFRRRPEYRFRGAVHEQIVDVIREKNHSACYRSTEEVTIIHYGYLDEQVAGKDKINRNLSLLARELDAAPDNRLLRYHYGVELYRAQKYAEAAAELLRAARGIDAQTIYLPKLLRHLVLSYYAANEQVRALEIIRQGLELFPAYADLYYYGGLICFERRDYGRAAEFFRQALAAPEQPVHFASFFGMRGFRACYQLGRLAEIFLNEEEAMRYYILSLQDNPAFLPALENICRLLRPWEDPAYAERCLEQLCDFCTPQANLLLGRILFQQQAYALALNYLEKGTADGNATPDILLPKAVCLAQQKRFLEALRLLDNFQPGQTHYPTAVLNKLLCFWWQGKQRRVRVLAEELAALGLAPETEAVITLLKRPPGKGRAKICPGEEGMSLFLDILSRTLALGDEERAARLLDGITAECRRRNAGVIGRLYFRHGYIDRAEDYLELHRQAYPQCADTLSLLARLKEQRLDYPAAAALYRQALSLDPDRPEYYIRSIRLYEKMRREILRQAVQKYPASEYLYKLLEEAAEK